MRLDLSNTLLLVGLSDFGVDRVGEYVTGHK